MKVVKVRSPFIIEVPSQGSTHVGSRIILSIWNNGTSEPISGLGYYELTKANPSATQKLTVYNVSNFVSEFIDNTNAEYVNFIGAVENSKGWANFRVKKYWYNGSVYTELSNELFVGVNGFTNYSDGNQTPSNVPIELLANTNIKNYYYSQETYLGNAIQYFNLIIEKLTTNNITVKYERIDNTVYSTTINFATGLAGIFNAKVPISLIKVDPNFVNGCKVTISFLFGSTTITSRTFFTYPTEECKYTPVLCDFINRYGGWQTITFFKHQANNVNVRGTDFKLMPDSINYNPFRGQTKSFNKNGTQTIKLNTGFVDENYSELITDLLLSETVLLDSKPVIVKTSGSELKTTLKDKLINYEMDFEFSFNLINDVV